MVRDGDATTEPQSFFRVAGRYILSPAIAAGGMASVHLARSISAEGFSRTVAIKRMHPHLLTNEELVTMFRDEARMCMRIQHPNVVPVLDVVDQSGELLLVMDYVHGESLVQVLKLASAGKQRLPLAVASSIICDVLHGLHAAHTATAANGGALHVVHRDVSPHNVLVGIDGVARMTDFGIAKAQGRLRTTQDGMVRGKLAYMAPEQVRGEEVSARTDVYGAGVLLWEALAARPLYAGTQEAQLVYQVLDTQPVAPGTLVQGIPPSLDAIVLRALSKDADLRFQSAEEMANAVEQAVPPASQSAVGATVKHWASKRLEQRQRVLSALEHEAETVGQQGAAIVQALAPPPGVVPARGTTPTPTVSSEAAGAPTAAEAPAPAPTAPAALPAAATPLPAPRAKARLKPSPLDPGAKKRSVLGPLLFLLLLLCGIGLAVHRWDKVAPMVDNPSAAPLEMMCWGDDAAACRRLAEVYEKGQDVDQDIDRARMLYEHSCSMGSSDGCVSLAQFIVKHAETPTPPETLARQRELLQQACDAENHNGCGVLGRLLLTSSDASDANRGAELLSAACDQYDYESCAELGMAYYEGKTIKKDFQRARGLCQSACDRASLVGCSCIHHLDKAEKR